MSDQPQDQTHTLLPERLYTTAVQWSKFVSMTDPIVEETVPNVVQLHKNLLQYTSLMGGNLYCLPAGNGGRFAILHKHRAGVNLRGWVMGVYQGDLEQLFERFTEELPPNIGYNIQFARPLVLTKDINSMDFAGILDGYSEAGDEGSTGIKGKFITNTDELLPYDEMISELLQVMSEMPEYESYKIEMVRALKIDSVTANVIKVELIIAITWKSWVKQDNSVDKLSQHVTINFYPEIESSADFTTKEGCERHLRALQQRKEAGGEVNEVTINALNDRIKTFVSMTQGGELN
jgi:hypothetical protein